MLGHSIGEFAAACIADVFSLEEALQAVAARGRLMQSMPRGAMLSIMSPAQQIEPILPSTISVAAINSPSSVVVARAPRGCRRARRRFAERRGFLLRRCTPRTPFIRA